MDRGVSDDANRVARAAIAADARSAAFTQSYPPEKLSQQDVEACYPENARPTRAS